jgi:hypothetical protein
MPPDEPDKEVVEPQYTEKDLDAAYQEGYKEGYRQGNLDAGNHE